MFITDEEIKQQQKLAVAKAAVQLVKDGDVVGLGTGSTATLAIIELGKLVKEGLDIIGVPSSEETKRLALSLGLPLLALGEVKSIDISIDGADEFTLALDLVKGGGGALFREKIVASLSKRSVIITDATKKVAALGAFKIPVEVVPVAYQYVINQVEKLNGKPILRKKADQPFITDNQNYIIDVDFGLITAPALLAQQLNQIEGLLAHGIFVGLAHQVLMAEGNEIISYTKPNL